jgi:hypothetical protein
MKIENRSGVMRRYNTISGLILLFTVAVFGEIIDTFHDDNFTANPVWSGITGGWQVVRDSDCAAGASNSKTLRLNVDSGSGVVFLSTDGPSMWGVEQSWAFWLGRREQAATSSNTNIVWLWANEANLLSATVDGYRVRFGDNSGDDEIYLERVEDNAPTVVIASSGSIPNGLTDFGFLVRVTRTSASEWSLYTSTLPQAVGAGAVATAVPSKINTPVLQGKATDGTFKNFTDGYIGVMAGFSSSATARSGAEFDQIYFDHSSDATLPVQLSFFNATPQNGRVKIDWVTQSEIDNLGFYVQRASEEKGVFLEISLLIPGAGTSTEKHDYHFVDDRVEPSSYWYKLKQIDVNGAVKLYGPLQVNLVSEKSSEDTSFPAQAQLNLNYPNPFNPATTISLSIGGNEKTLTTISIYDTLGREVIQLYRDYLLPGLHELHWAGEDKTGCAVSAGVYFCRMETATGFVSTIKLLKVD